ncbi:type-2Aa cytolytic delta-endotoxin, partial [Priestia megaterium]|nr:type-2Aa cytolytic delta-endotoxin [Priestia megaterium]
MGNNNFCEVFYLEEKYSDQVLKLRDAFQEAVDSTELSFNFEQARNIAANTPNSNILITLNQ